MKNELTAKRIQFALSKSNMKPQELADKSCIGKASISQYINGSHAPGNISAKKIGKVLNVNPLWLMGFDVPMEQESVNLKEEAPKIMQYYKQLNDIGKHKATERVKELTYVPEYSAEPLHLMVDAAHEIENSSQDDKQYDEDIMDDENF